MCDINEYGKFVHFLAESDDTRTFFNSDEDHALKVLVELIRKTEHELRIFAGCLCKHVGDCQEYVMALSDFIENGGDLYILLNDYDEQAAKSSDLYKRLAYYICSGKKSQIHIKTTKTHPYRKSDPDKKGVHFTVGDRKSYRMEIDTDKRTAECSFNNQERAKMLVDFYDNEFNGTDAEELDITKLFM